ncbi:MAG: FmdE family protein [Thermodesulfobacteriota bacterium]
MRKTKRKFFLLLIFSWFFFINGTIFGENSLEQEWFKLVERVMILAGEIMEVKDKSSLLTLTNASFVKLGKEETLPLLDVIYEKVGCSLGKKNLILLRSSPNRSLYLFFFNREKGRIAYFEIHPSLSLRNLDGKREEDIFSKMTLLDFQWEEILRKPSEWEKRFKEKFFGEIESRLISIAILWIEGLPQEVMRAVELHDHLCPGLLSGYYITKFVLDELTPMEGMDYFVIGSPVWCKDDMVQSMLNTTPGKRNFVVLPLTEKEKEHLKDQNVTGIFLQFNKKSGGGKGLVVGFDWKRLEKDAGFDRERFPGTWRLWLALYMTRHLNDYLKYIYVIKKFDIEKGEKPENYFSVKLNPWEKIGLWKD